MSNPLEPQPAPPPFDPSKPALWDLVIADVAKPYGVLGHASATINQMLIDDMRTRDAFGLAKYKTRLQAGNGRDALSDAYQESLDLCVYLRQDIVESGDGDGKLADYYGALRIAQSLRRRLSGRK